MALITEIYKRKIAFATSEETKEFEVAGCYPYLENTTTGKVVLVVTGKEEDGVTEADVHALVDNVTGVVDYFEQTKTYDPEDESVEPVYSEWVKKNSYEDYNSGEIRTSYKDGMYEGRVTRVDGIVKEQMKQKAAIDFLNIWTDAPVAE